jgi:glycerophosphoryl diester phosphodiesterase
MTNEFMKTKLQYLVKSLTSLSIAACAAVVCSAQPDGASSGGGTSKAEALLSLHRPLVIGHRGFCILAPENTLPSFHDAVIAGADLVELDYHHTKDGQLLVCHDGEVDRTTDAREKWNAQHIKIANKTAAELQTLEAGVHAHPPIAGVRLPLLSQALDEIQKGSVTLIERKAGDPAACIRLLKDKNLINSVVVQSFDWKYLEEFHKEEPEQILGALGPIGTLHGKKLSKQEQALSPEFNDEIKRIGARAAVWNSQVSREAVEDAHKKGLKVWVYTIDDPAAANRLLDMGVDGIISNNCSIIWKTLALRPRTNSRTNS